MTAKEFLEKEAKRFRVGVAKGVDTDAIGLRPEIPNRNGEPSAFDAIELAAILQEAGYSLSFRKDGSIQVLAPHRHQHAGHGPKDLSGWSCTHGLTVQGCEAVACPSCNRNK